MKYTSIINDMEFATVEAESFEDAFQKLFGDYIHKEIDEKIYSDASISNSEETKHYWIRSG